jgi:transposase
MKQKAFLGIDVSKGYSDFLLLDQDKQQLEQSFQLQDNPAGRKQLQLLIEDWFSQGLQELYCGVESTGGYENNWYSFLKTLSARYNVKAARLNAKGVKAVSDATLKRTITDAVSAENIAVYLISFPEKINYKQPEGSNGFKEGRQHHSYINMLLKQKVQLTNQLEKLLYQNFPEILVYCRHGIPGWLLRLLTRYCCAQTVLKAGEVKLSAIKGISKDKAQALLQKCDQQSAPVSKQLQHVVSATAKEILHKEDLINDEKSYLTDLYKNHDQVKLLSTIKGIGVDSAVLYMLEIEDVNKFETVKKLASNFGVHPTFKQSGDGTWGSHMSKKGRGALRAMLYINALSGIRCNPILKQLYARHRAKGMKHYQAMGVVMHKLLRIIYGVLKNKKEFDVETDVQNQQRSSEKQKEKQEAEKEKKEIKSLKKYRYQPLSVEAPISRIAAKKRKEQIVS